MAKTANTLAGAVLSCLIATAGSSAPLSRIGWLSKPLPETEVAPVIDPSERAEQPQPPTLRPPSRSRLDAAGLVATSLAGVNQDIWARSDSSDLTAQLATLPRPELPSMQRLLERLLLVSAAPPGLRGTPDGNYLLARIDALLGWGMVEPALALSEAADAATPGLALRWLEAGLLAGDAQRVCELITAERLDMLPLAEQVFCLARLGQWNEAQTRLDEAEDGALTPDMALLLRLFLDDELSEETTPPLPRPLTPLAFRLREAIGAPIDTRRLPAAFAVADLRDVAGFKAQVEAAERLAKIGAISSNRWIGVFSSGRAAASGGVWERVAAIQRFDAALENADTSLLLETLSNTRVEIEQAGLTAPFAEIYGARLLLSVPENTALPEEIFRIALLSDAREAAAQRAPETPEARFLVALAIGEPGRAQPSNALAASIRQGWEGPGLSFNHQQLLAQERMGELILIACELLSDGARADPRAISQGLAILLQAGMENTARQAALEMMLLDGNAR